MQFSADMAPHPLGKGCLDVFTVHVLLFHDITSPICAKTSSVHYCYRCDGESFWGNQSCSSLTTQIVISYPAQCLGLYALERTCTRCEPRDEAGLNPASSLSSQSLAGSSEGIVKNTFVFYHGSSFQVINQNRWYEKMLYLVMWIYSKNP